MHRLAWLVLTHDLAEFKVKVHKVVISLFGAGLAKELTDSKWQLQDTSLVIRNLLEKHEKGIHRGGTLFRTSWPSQPLAHTADVHRQAQADWRTWDSDVKGGENIKDKEHV
jgi:hypothetical protein